MKLVLVGGGGHARVVAETATSAGFTVIGVLTPDAPAPGLERLGDDSWLEQIGPDTGAHVAFGPVPGSPARQTQFDRIRALGIAVPVLVSPDARVSPTAVVGDGVLVVQGAIINAGARIGPNTIINSGAIVEHDAAVGGNSHVAPGAVIAGGSSVGQSCVIGLGAIILPGLSIADRVVIGAGAVVTRSVTEPGSTWVGNPARSLA